MGKAKSIDEILELTGGFGRYQWRLLIMMACCMTTLGLNALSMTFIASEPPWKCQNNSTICLHNSTISSTMSDYKQMCTMNESEWTYESQNTSIVAKYRLYCDRSILKNTATSIVYLGWLCGNIIFGLVSDRFGRRVALLASTAIMAIAGVSSTFVNVFWMFALLKMLVGSGIGGGMISIFILNTEYAGPKKRAFAGNLVWIFWVIGLVLSAVLAYFLKDWKHLNLATSIPGFVVFLICHYIPESARWYLVHGRSDKALQILKHVGDVNGVPLPTDVVLEETCSQGKSHGYSTKLFKNRLMIVYILVCLLLWFTCSMIYYGISLSSGNLGGNIHLVFSLTSSVSIPGHCIGIFLLDKFGRKKIIVINLVLTALAMIGASLFSLGESNTVNTVLRVTLSMLGKFLLQVVFDAAYLITYEIFPTTLRNIIMGISSASGQIGSISASYIIYLKDVSPILPYMIFGIIVIVCAMTCVLLPETNHTPTKETLADKNNSNHEQADKELLQMTGKEEMKLL